MTVRYISTSTTPGHYVDAVLGALVAQVAAGAGLPLSLAPTHLTGTGSSIETALTIDPRVAIVDREKYRIDGIIRVNAHGGSHWRVVAVQIVGMVLVFASAGGGSWSVENAGTYVATPGVDANPFFVTDYLARAGATFTASELPTIGTVGPDLTLALTLLSGASADIEFDGTIARQGPSGVP